MKIKQPYTTAALCENMLKLNRDTISIRKPEIAVPKLVAIIDAALTLSNHKGFQAMSLRDLSREAGVSMGGLYAYIDSKETLLNMILSQVTASVKEVLHATPHGIRDDPIAHLTWLIDVHIRLTEEMLAWFTFSFMEAKNFPQKERRMAVDSEILTEEIFAHVVQRANEQGLFRKDVTPLLPSLIKPLLQDWYVKRAKYRRRGISVETYIQTVQDFVLGYCLPADKLN